uniref:WGS project CAEQ00000000 data, annotated contig 495 n=1 Tax=Trypanosoma congolense (strain IL3000) TaxID=1068625 RepID=F9WGE9_TRYCI|nr:unnamed protein product [Trypanosoma congolense IL3000]
MNCFLFFLPPVTFHPEHFFFKTQKKKKRTSRQTDSQRSRSKEVTRGKKCHNSPVVPAFIGRMASSLTIACNPPLLSHFFILPTLLFTALFTRPPPAYFLSSSSLTPFSPLQLFPSFSCQLPPFRLQSYNIHPLLYVPSSPSHSFPTPPPPQRISKRKNNNNNKETANRSLSPPSI